MERKIIPSRLRSSVSVHLSTKPRVHFLDIGILVILAPDGVEYLDVGAWSRWRSGETLPLLPISLLLVQAPWSTRSWLEQSLRAIRISVALRIKLREQAKNTFVMQINRLPISIAPHHGRVPQELATQLKRRCPAAENPKGFLVISEMWRMMLIRDCAPGPTFIRLV